MYLMPIFFYFTFYLDFLSLGSIHSHIITVRLSFHSVTSTPRTKILFLLTQRSIWPLTSSLVTLVTGRPCVFWGVCWWCQCRRNQTQTCCRRWGAGIYHTTGSVHSQLRRIPEVPLGVLCVEMKWFVLRNPTVSSLKFRFKKLCFVWFFFKTWISKVHKNF